MEGELQEKIIKIENKLLDWMKTNERFKRTFRETIVKDIVEESELFDRLIELWVENLRSTNTLREFVKECITEK